MDSNASKGDRPYPPEESPVQLPHHARVEADRADAIVAFRQAVGPQVPPEIVIQALYESWRNWITVALTHGPNVETMDRITELWEAPAHIVIGRFTDHYFAFDRFARDACEVFGRKYTRTVPNKPRHPTP